MKQNLYTLVIAAMAMTGSVGAAELHATPSQPGELIGLLAEDAAACTRETLATGLPIHAAHVTRNVLGHQGLYANGAIETRISDRTMGRLGVQLLLGEQRATFCSTPSCENVEIESMSKAWRVETVGGVRWVVHYHEGFRVYSRGDQQFVIVS